MSRFVDVLENRNIPLNCPLEDKVKHVLGIDSLDRRDASNTLVPAIIKLIAYMATNEIGDMYTRDTTERLADGDIKANSYAVKFSTGALATFSFWYKYDPSITGNVSMSWTLSRIAPPSSPSGMPSYYQVGVVLPMIINTWDWKQMWQDTYDVEVKSKGFENLAQADWVPFHNIIHQVIQRCIYTSEDGDLTAPAASVFKDLNLPELIDSETIAFHPTRGWNALDLRELVPVYAHESEGLVNMTSAVPDKNVNIRGYIGPEVALAMLFFGDAKHTMLMGPTGCGKNKCVDCAFAELGVDYIMYSGTESTTDEQLLGVNSMNGDGKIVWNDGPLTRAMREGKPLFLDEFNRIPIRMQNVVISTMAGAMCVFLNEKDGEQVFAQPGFFIVIAINPDGAIHGSDKAVNNRFSRIINFNYPEEASREVDIIMSELPHADETVVKIMVDVAQQTRELALTGELLAGLSTRRVMDWADLHSKMGGLMTESAEYTIVNDLCGLQEDNHYNIENHTMVMEIIKYKGGK